jgi:hypothetical protein
VPEVAADQARAAFRAVPQRRFLHCCTYSHVKSTCARLINRLNTDSRQPAVDWISGNNRMSKPARKVQQDTRGRRWWS